MLQLAAQYYEDTASSTRTSVNRHRDIGLETLENDWFVETPKYNDEYFKKKSNGEKHVFANSG